MENKSLSQAGLIEIDYDTMARTPKKRALWYAEVGRTGSVG